MLHLLLDAGADIDKMNSEGMSALAVCHVLYYPFHRPHFTEAPADTPPGAECKEKQEVVQESRKEKKEVYLNTLKLLLKRGADPNTSRNPMPILFLAILGCDREGVERLLLLGARADIPLPPEVEITF